VADRTQALTRELAARERAEKKLVEFQRMRAASQLTGGVAHEFNNLLTVVKSNAEDLRDELKAQPLLKQQADLIVRAADRGGGFVRQLLTFSRKQEMQPKLLDINAFLDSALGLVRSMLEANIKIEIHQAADLPFVKVDPIQLESAVLNIVGNARDAMPGGGTVTLETALVNVDAEYANRSADVVPGSYVQIAITDTGTGMAPEVLESAFVPFFTTKEVGDGTGLGLSTVHGFVTQSGGFVHLYSELGYGTCAKMYFPAAANISGPVVAPAAVSESRPPSAARILVIEDDELVRLSVQRRLTALGYTVVVAASADEGLAQLENDGTVDAVFSDVIMPGRLNGADLAREVQRRWPYIPVLLTSGYTETTTLGKVNIPTGIRVLTKPYANADLEDALRAMLTSVGIRSVAGNA
jgi:nitrogen-specific signal transduction histidine kinase/ActR/RegA family two-component response regulator